MRFEKDLERKPAVKDLKAKLNRVYNTHKEYERAVKKTFELVKEQVTDTLTGETPEEQSDLSRIIKQTEKQREAIVKNYIYELKRLYRYLDTIEDKDLNLIFTLRHAHFLTWQQIADCIGRGLTTEDAKRKHNRYIIEVVSSAKETPQAM